MIKILLVGTGGFLGALFRYWTKEWVEKMIYPAWLPYGTMTVNLLGCFLMGFFSGIAIQRSPLSNELNAFFVIGFLGSFTTFSTFGLDTFNLLKDEQALAAMLNVLLQVTFGVTAVFGGIVLAGKLP